MIQFKLDPYHFCPTRQAYYSAKRNAFPEFKYGLIGYSFIMDGQLISGHSVAVLFDYSSDNIFYNSRKWSHADELEEIKKMENVILGIQRIGGEFLFWNNHSKIWPI